jgi:hypothetical protein
METPGRLLARTSLESGLVILFYDQSRPVLGDRWLVQLLIDIPVSLDAAIFERHPEAEPTVNAFLTRFGSTLHYQVTKARHFVPKQDVDSVLSELQQEFTSAGLAYLQNPAFGKRYALKTYGEWAEKERCRLAHARAVAATESGKQ